MNSIRVSSVGRNVLGYLLWRWILRNNGAFISYLDKKFWGLSRGLNEYNALAPSYKKSDIKPDKQYSMLPTVIQLVGDCEGKVVLDLGCGSGFFTVPIAEQGAEVVCGIDNSSAQIELAYKHSAHPKVQYHVSDIFDRSFAPADVVVVPFVLNYARTTSVLEHFLLLVYQSLKIGGKAVLVVDLPNGKSLERFGAKKSFSGELSDEMEVCIDLYNGESKICTLHSVFYSPHTIERLLKSVGFTDVCWHKPVISSEGINTLGIDFWKGYVDDPELGYLVAYK